MPEQERGEEKTEGAPEGGAAAAPPVPKAERPAKAAEGKVPVKQPAPPGSIADTIREVLPDLQFEAYQGLSNIIVEINRDDIAKTLPVFHSDPRLDLKFMRCLFGVDHADEGMDVVYQLLSLEKKHEVVVKTRLAQNDLRVPSVSSVWKAADWHERETRDMFGIVFEGHEHLVPLLLPEDMTDHFPLRKDNPLAPVEEWQGERVGEDEVANVGHIPPGSRYESLGGGKETEE